MAIKAIQGNSFIKRNEEKNDFYKERGKNKFNNRNYENSLNAKENKDKTGGKFNEFQKRKKSVLPKKECGKQHFQSECPFLINKENSD